MIVWLSMLSCGVTKYCTKYSNIIVGLFIIDIIFKKYMSYIKIFVEKKGKCFFLTNLDFFLEKNPPCG